MLIFFLLFGRVGWGWVGGWVTSIYICIYIIYIKPPQRTNRPCPGGSPLADRKRKQEDIVTDGPPAKHLRTLSHLPTHCAKKHRVATRWTDRDYDSLRDLVLHLKNQCGREGVFPDGSRFSWMAVDVGEDADRPRILKRRPGAFGLSAYAFNKASPPRYIYYIYITSLIFIL